MAVVDSVFTELGGRGEGFDGFSVGSLIKGEGIGKAGGTTGTGVGPLDEAGLLLGRSLERKIRVGIIGGVTVLGLC